MQISRETVRIQNIRNSFSVRLVEVDSTAGKYWLVEDCARGNRQSFSLHPRREFAEDEMRMLVEEYTALNGRH